MYYNLEEIIAFCVQHKIRVEEFNVLYMFYKQKENPENAKYLFNYCVNCGTLSTALMERLHSKGFIKPLFKTPIIDERSFSFERYEITEKTKEIFYVNFDFADEIFDIYPPFIIGSNGRQFVTRNIGPEEVEEMMIEKIKKKRVSSSSEVLNGLRDHVRNNAVTMGLKKYIETEAWKVKYEEGFQPEIEL
jgi:hypothetical protein